jgi:beta-galactosidase
VIDLCGFPKDTFYYYQSQWKTEPMVHLLPHWTWAGLEGKTIPVICYTNCERVELFLDDKSLGVQEMTDMCLRWDVPYQPGTLKAVGYRADTEVATCIHETASAPAALKLECDVEKLTADKTSIAHIAVTVVDEQGRFVPRADNTITVKVAGQAKLLGLENGDPIDSTNYKLNHRKAFNGMALAIIQSTGDAGDVTVTVTADGIEGEKVVLTSD